MDCTNSDLIRAFPEALRSDALRVVSTLPKPDFTTTTFSIRVATESVSIPHRIYHNPALIDSGPLSTMQVELLGCLLTRHCSGFVREDSLAKILSSSHVWIPAFVVPLVGEYVIEIINLVRQNMQSFDPQLYRKFLTDNPEFYAKTKQRVVSYWDCYYRWQHREDYPGFQILEYFDSLIATVN